MEEHLGLPPYDGPAKECYCCERPFKDGDMIYVARLGIVFCTKNNFRCASNWCSEHKVAGTPFTAMEFKGDDGFLGNAAFV